MDNCIFVEIVVSPSTNRLKNNFFNLCVKAVVFTRKSVRFVFPFVLVAAILISLSIAHLFIDIFTSEEYPAAIKNYVYMKLFL